MRATLDRIAAVNPALTQSSALQDEGDLLRQADARDAALARGASLGWLLGMPQAIKDAAETEGIRRRSARRSSRDPFPTTTR